LSEQDPPFCLCIAGPNGSGKSTLTRGLRQQHQLETWIDPDVVAAEIGRLAKSRGLEAHQVSQEAFLAARSYRAQYAKSRIDFGFETVFSHISNVEFLSSLKEAGYVVHLYFVCTEDPQINIGRVRNRVSLGGHGVPENKIVDRYWRALNFLREVSDKVDRVVLIDNSRSDSFGRAIAEIRNGSQTEILLLQKSSIPEWAAESLAGFLRAHSFLSSLRKPSFSEKRLETPETFSVDVIDGLSQHPKRLSTKCFYDATGSELFEQITLSPEYYPTRTELSILRDRGKAISAIIPKGAALVEFGAGATTKVRLLLTECTFGAYVPVDISGDFLNAQAEALRWDFPDLAVYPITADFTAPFALPEAIASMPKVGFFPGSTLGNFEPQEAAAFLRSARDILGGGAQMMIGVDLEKDESLLYAAYNDAAGVTARFNLNVLHRINRELGGNFDLAAFIHRAIYNRERNRIEMHLISRKAQTVRVLGHSFSFRAGESIHTENNYKYSLDRFNALARGSGWTPRETWTDAAGMFSVHALVASD
jgi:dimethylhistidine N-methyltransferase